MTSPFSGKRDPWWPIAWGQECGPIHYPHRRITLPTMEVFAVHLDDPDEKGFGVALMRQPGLNLDQHTAFVRCDDALELRTKLLALAYPDG